MPGLVGKREDPGRTPCRARPADTGLVVLFDALWFGEAADPETTSISRRAKGIVSEPTAPPVHHLEDDVAPQGVVSALEVGVHRSGMRLPSALGPRPHRPRGHTGATAASWHPAMPPQLGAPPGVHSAPPGPTAMAHTLAGAAGGGLGMAPPPRLDLSTWLPTAAAADGSTAAGWLTPGAFAGGAPSPASDPGVMLPGAALSRMTSCPAVLPWPLQQQQQQAAGTLAVPDGALGHPPGQPRQWPQRWSPTIGTLLLSGGDALMQRSASAPAAPHPLADAVEEEGSEAGGGSGTSQRSGSNARWAAAGSTGHHHTGVNSSCSWRSVQAADGAAAAVPAAAAAGPADGGWRGDLDKRSNSGALSALSEVALGQMGDSTSTSITCATPTTSSPMTCDTGRSSTDLSLPGVASVPGVTGDARCEVCGMSPVVEDEVEGGEPRCSSARTCCTCPSQPQLPHGADPSATPAAAGGGGLGGGGVAEALQSALLSGASGWPAAAGSPPPGCSWGRAVYHSATSMEAAAEAAVAALGGSEAVAHLLAGLAGSGVLSGAEGGATVEVEEEEEEPGQHLLCDTGSSDTGSSLPSSAAQLHQEQQLAAAMAVMAAAAAAAHHTGLDGMGGAGGMVEATSSGSSGDAAAWRYWFAARWRQARRAHLQGRGQADSPDPLQFLKVHGEGVAAQLAAAAAAGQAQQQQQQQGGNQACSAQRQQKQGAVGGGVTSSRGGATGTHGSASRLLSSALALDSDSSSWPVVSGSGGLMGCSGGEAVAELAREAAAAAALLQAAHTGARPMPAGVGGGAVQQPSRNRSHMAPAPAAGGAAAGRPVVVGPLDRRWVGMLVPAAAVTLGGDNRQAFIMARLLDGCAGAAKVLLRGAPRVPPEQLLADLQLEVTAAAAAARLPNTALVQFCGAGVLRVDAGRSVHVVMSSAPTPAPLAGGGTSSAVADVAASVARGLVGDSGSLAAAAAALLRTHLPHDLSITY